MLFSFTGRLNRARFWLATIVLCMVSLILAPIPILFSALIATSSLFLSALVLVSFANLSVLFAGLAIAIKRLHDRDKSAWWLLLFYLVPAILQTVAYYTTPGTGAVEVRVILGLACIFVVVWYLVELGFLRGTAGPNRYGPDPLQIALTQGTRAPARFATIALLTLSGAVLVAELLTLSGAVLVGKSVLSAISPWMQTAQNGAQRRSTAAPNEAQGQPQPPVAPNEAQRQPQPPAAPDRGHADLGEVTSGVEPSGAAPAPAKPDQGNGASPPPAAHKPNSVVTGVWSAYDVGFPPWTLTLKADRANLSGTVQQGVRASGYSTTLTMPAAIYDGEIDGNKITFKCQDPWSHDRTITFTGIVNGDEITFTRTVQVKPGGRPGTNGIFGVSGAAEFTAQRLALSGAASAPTELDQVNGAKPPPAGQRPDIVRGGASAAGRR
jgi:uncharacterized membrane protein YhaH (DUF805 family)